MKRWRVPVLITTVLQTCHRTWTTSSPIPVKFLPNCATRRRTTQRGTAVSYNLSLRPWIVEKEGLKTIKRAQIPWYNVMKGFFLRTTFKEFFYATTTTSNWNELWRKKAFLCKSPWSFLCLKEGPHQTDDTSIKQKEEGGNCLIAWSVLKSWTSS